MLGWRVREATSLLSWIISMPNMACTPGRKKNWTSESKQFFYYTKFTHWFLIFFSLNSYYICHEPAVTAAIFTRYIFTMDPRSVRFPNPLPTDT